MYRGMVASKYASLSRLEYETYLGNENKDEVLDFRIQLQIITGWTYIDTPRMVYESELALTRLGIYRDQCIIPYFEISSKGSQKWYELLGHNSHMLKQTNNGLTIEIPSFMAACFEISTNKTIGAYGRIVAYIVCILFGMMPNLVRVSCPTLASMTYSNEEHHKQLCTSSFFFGEGMLANIYSFTLMMQGIALAVPLNFFLLTLILSSMRLYKCGQLFGYLIRNDSRSFDDYPILDLKNPNNIRAWVRSFQALYQVGARYKQRLDMYTRCCGLLMVLVIINVFYHFFFDNTTVSDDSTDDDGNTPNTLFVELSFWVVIFLLIVWGAIFGLALAIIAANNKAVLRQELELLQRRLCLRENLHQVRGRVNQFTAESDNRAKQGRRQDSVSKEMTVVDQTKRVSHPHYWLEKSNSELEEAETGFEEVRE
mmetsp:Transcript_20915/g.27200  ORF Transcript_20915/g.27200 Transcript_20915/m.27200 type:complete len:426 (+) Transcript_20915:384-1661(+)